MSTFEEAWEEHVKSSSGGSAPNNLLKDICRVFFNVGMEHAADIVKSHTTCLSAPFLTSVIRKKIKTNEVP